jgi:16S rRNA (cytosine967-C5)-methyltransferase
MDPSRSQTKTRLQEAADARTLAVRILTELERPPETRRTLDGLMAECEGAAAIRLKQDRDLLNALVFGVLRWRGRLDHLLAHFSKTPLEKIEAPVLNVLRVGLFQLVHLDRIPPSAAVNTAVNMAKGLAGPWVAPFVNAVLRQAAAGHAAVPFPDRRAEPVESRAAAGAFPKWLVGRWIGRYGAEAADRLIDAVNSVPALTLRANRLRASRAELIEALSAAAERVEASEAAPDAVRVLGLRGRLTQLEAFAAGWFQVQDESSQLVSLLLDPQPGESVLDACAGRGGKTGHLAQLMGDRGTLTAADRSAERLAQLRAELGRLRFACVSVREHDWEAAGPALSAARYDRILLDAPCSGLGTLRRNPDIKWSARKADLARHGAVQARLLGRVAALLKPGGRLVYAVCSPEPEETEQVVQAFVSRNPGFAVDTGLAHMPPAAAALIDGRGYLQTYPAAGYMDGFFAVRFEFKGPE